MIQKGSLIMEENLYNIYKEMGFSEDVCKYAFDIEKGLKDRFDKIDKIAEFNQLKVIKAMQDCRLSDAHFGVATGYGYTDIGRDKLEEIYVRYRELKRSNNL